MDDVNRSAPTRALLCNPMDDYPANHYARF